MCKILNRCLVVSLLVLGGVGTQALAEKQKYAVIGNAEITVDVSTIKQEVKRLYLKQQSTWSDGAPAKAFDSPEDSPKHIAFRRAVANMGQARLKAHWLSLKQRTGETPPRIVHKTRKLIRLIGKNEGGFGVINQSEVDLLTDDVRILFVFDH